MVYCIKPHTNNGDGTNILHGAGAKTICLGGEIVLCSSTYSIDDNGTSGIGILMVVFEACCGERSWCLCP